MIMHLSSVENAARIVRTILLNSLDKYCINIKSDKKNCTKCYIRDYDSVTKENIITLCHKVRYMPNFISKKKGKGGNRS